MGGNRRPFQYFIAFSLFFPCFKGCYGEAGCIERERQALLQFKQDVVDDFRFLSSWGVGKTKEIVANGQEWSVTTTWVT